jgi:hypothetical protein
MPATMTITVRAPCAAMDLRAWNAAMAEVVALVDASGGAPYTKNAAQRCALAVCFPLACGLCCAWSVLGHALARHPAAAARCTDAPDRCVAWYARGMDEAKVLPPMPRLGAATPAADATALVAAIAALMTARHHALVDAVVRPLVRDTCPFVVARTAAQALRMLRLRVLLQLQQLPAWDGIAMAAKTASGTAAGAGQSAASWNM